MVSRTAVGLGIVLVTAVALGVGIVIGHFALPPRTTATPPTPVPGLKEKCGTQEDPEDNPAVKDFMDHCERASCEAIKCDMPYPVSYVAHHLNGAQIVVDGRLDDEAWKNTPTIDNFVNIRGTQFPGPPFVTQVKIRWDNDFLYIGAYLEDEHIWATKTEHDTRVWLDNAFEVFLDADMTTHYYKEWQINAINTTWDLLLTKPYLNGGTNISAWELEGGTWSVYVNGTVNNPNDTDKFWTAEVAMPFRSLVENNTNPTTTPSNGDQWRINLSRVQYQLDVVNGQYQKKPGTSGDFWVFSPQMAVALHIPERWGFLQFSTESSGTAYQRWPNWSVYTSLIATYDAVKMYQGLNGPLPLMEELVLPPHVKSGKCSKMPKYNMTDDSFVVEVEPVSSNLATGTITDDRYISFR